MFAWIYVCCESQFFHNCGLNVTRVYVLTLLEMTKFLAAAEYQVAAFSYYACVLVLLLAREVESMLISGACRKCALRS